MEQQIALSLHRERMFAMLCDGFGILALVLAIVGLYGIMAYQTGRRRGEIGIRLALGAVPRNVVAMVMREGLGLAVLGALAGLPVIWLGSRYVAAELTQMRPVEPVSLTLALSILLAAATIAVGIPAIRASRVRPMDMLRRE